MSAPAVTLGVGGAVTQSAGTLTTATLSGSAGGAVALTDVNAIGTLGGFASRGGFLLGVGSALTVSGPLSDPAFVGLNTGGNLTLAGAITTPALSLITGGSLAQTGGTIATTILSGSSAGAAALARRTQSAR